jgi:Arc/MetJ family transcription regulator
VRTTIELDDELVAQARQVLGGPSLKAMVEESLREAIRARGREMLRRALGNYDLAIDEHDLEEMRRGHSFE